jgi:DNA polymerase III alpha subunit
MTIPFFKSHYSIGKSILTLQEEGESIDNGPQSIIDLCKKNDIKDLHLVDDSMSGFLQGYLNSQKAGLNFRFGLRISVCDNMEEKNEEEINKTSKLIIFANNKAGYKRLIKIYTKAAQEGFYYVPRIDYRSLKDFWNDKDLSLVVPFYDSFLHKNTLHGTICTPDLSFCDPLFAVEDNDVPFNYLIRNRVKEFCEKNKCINVKSVFYNKKEDFKAFLTFRCINNRTTLDKPNLDHMTSNEFCLESWRESSE